MKDYSAECKNFLVSPDWYTGTEMICWVVQIIWIDIWYGMSLFQSWTLQNYQQTRRVDGNANILSHPVGKNILCLRVTLWLCFTSGHPSDFCPFRSMTIEPPIPEIQFDLEFSRSKVKVKGTLVSVTSSWLISFLFHINWTNHSKDMANRMFHWGKRI